MKNEKVYTNERRKSINRRQWLDATKNIKKNSFSRSFWLSRRECHLFFYWGLENKQMIFRLNIIKPESLGGAATIPVLSIYSTTSRQQRKKFNTISFIYSPPKRNAQEFRDREKVLF
jgi:hypothetical protein